MGFFTKIEQLTASKLKNIFLDADKLVSDSEDAIKALEAKLISEKQKIADLAHQAHQAAIAAAEKAKKEAEDLVDAAWQAEQRALKHTANIPQPTAQIEPTLGNVVPNDSLATPETPPTNP